MKSTLQPATVLLSQLSADCEQQWSRK